MQNPIYRYKLREELSMELNDFANLHKYTPKKDLKECWEKWLKTTKVAFLVTSENERLQENGFTGDLIKKMYTAMKYYYMKQTPKKVQQSKETTTTTEKKEKRIYNKQEFVLNQEDHSNINTFLSINNNMSRKQSILWTEFIAVYPQYKDNKSLKKSLKNKVYQGKLKIKVVAQTSSTI